MPTEEERRQVLAAVAVELGAEVGRLTAAEGAQTEEITKLHGEITKLRAETREKTRITNKKINWMIGMVILCLFLSGGVVVLFSKIYDVVQTQEVFRAQGLCPQYRFLLGGYDPTTRTTGPDRDKYEAAFKDMWNQYGVLHCTGSLVPPRSDLVTTTPPSVPR